MGILWVEGNKEKVVNVTSIGILLSDTTLGKRAGIGYHVPLGLVFDPVK